MTGWMLVALDGEAPGRSWSLAAIPVDGLLVGSGAGADVRIDSPDVDPRHARLDLAAGALAVEDLGTVPGTAVNGRRITRPTRLRPGDTLAFGPVSVRLLDAPPTPTPAPVVVVERPLDLQPQPHPPAPAGLPADGWVQQQRAAVLRLVTRAGVFGPAALQTG